MQKYVIYIVVLLTFIASISFMVLKNRQVSRQSERMQELVNLHKIDSTYINQIRSYQLQSLKYNNSSLKKDIILIDGEGKKNRIDQVVTSNTLVFNFSVTNCSDCYRQILKLVSDYSQKDLIVIFNTDNQRAFQFFISNNKLKVRTYSADMTYQSFPSEKENLPCLFFLDNNLKLSNTYFPIMDDYFMTKHYLKASLPDVNITNFN